MHLDQVVHQERPGRLENIPGSICDASSRAPHGSILGV